MAKLVRKGGNLYREKSIFFKYQNNQTVKFMKAIFSSNIACDGRPVKQLLNILHSSS